MSNAKGSSDCSANQIKTKPLNNYDTNLTLDSIEDLFTENVSQLENARDYVYEIIRIAEKKGYSESFLLDASYNIANKLIGQGYFTSKDNLSKRYVAVKSSFAKYVNDIIDLKKNEEIRRENEIIRTKVNDELHKLDLHPKIIKEASENIIKTIIDVKYSAYELDSLLSPANLRNLVLYAEM